MTLVYPLQSLAAHPPRLSPAYQSTVKRSPTRPLIPMRHTLSELTGPVYGHETVRENDHDLTLQHKGEPLGKVPVDYLQWMARQATTDPEWKSAAGDELKRRRAA